MIWSLMTGWILPLGVLAVGIDQAEGTGRNLNGMYTTHSWLWAYGYET